MKRWNIDESIKSALNRGVIYAGSSAGSMLCAPDLTLADWYIGETEPGASYLPALNLVDFDFYPHYEDSLYDEIKQNYTGKKMYLMKNGEVITIVDGAVKVIGQERIIFGAK